MLCCVSRRVDDSGVRENQTSTGDIFLEMENKSHQIVGWVLLAGLLFLRLPFLAGIILFTRPGWLEPAFQIGTYLLTACLIWWERDRLTDFHIDILALGIIILFKPIQTIILAIWKFGGNPLGNVFDLGQVLQDELIPFGIRRNRRFVYFVLAR